MNKNYPNIILVDGTKGTSTIANLKYVNNATLVGNSTAGTGIWQPLGESGKVTHLANSGNIILADSNDSTVTGTLWAGNGVWVSDQIYNGR